MLPLSHREWSLAEAINGVHMRAMLHKVTGNG
jgi:hypothetical protein